MRTRGAIETISGKTPAVNERLLSAKEAADRLGMSLGWLSSSQVPRVKLGRRTLYRPSDIDAFVAAHVSHRVGMEGV
jgi:predicted DNA-binding transcriptional regulator AlpA